MFWTVFFAALLANIIGTVVTTGVRRIFELFVERAVIKMDAEREREEEERQLEKRMRQIR